MKTTQTDCWTYGMKVSLIVRQTNGWADEKKQRTDRQTDSKARWMDRQTDRWTDELAIGWTDRQTRLKAD